MGKVDATLTGKVTDRHRPHRDYRARIPLHSAGTLVKAAQERGMSVSAYLRRAGLAFAAYDLDLNLDQLLEDEPASRQKFDGPQADVVLGTDDHGPWWIQGLGRGHE